MKTLITILRQYCYLKSIVIKGSHCLLIYFFWKTNNFVTQKMFSKHFTGFWNVKVIFERQIDIGHAIAVLRVNEYNDIVGEVIWLKLIDCIL